MLLALVIAGLFLIGLDAMDRNIYPGCKVLGQDGRVLTIQLDDKFDGGDGACHAAGQLIYSITQDGYLVQVAQPHHMAGLGVIDRFHAAVLAEGY